MNIQYVWTIVQADGSDDKSISAIDWRCERFDEAGKTGEQSGKVQLSPEVPVSDFAKYGQKEQIALLKETVNTKQVEDSFEAV